MRKLQKPGHRLWRRELGAPDRIHSWYPIDEGRFPAEADERRSRLWAYAEVISETAARHGLSTVEVAKSVGWFRSTFVGGEEARTTLDDARRFQDGSSRWQLGDVAWSDIERSNVLVHHGDPDGWWPSFGAWGPKAETVFDDIDAGWSRIS